MNDLPSLDELRDLHKKCTYRVIQMLFRGKSAAEGWWLYSENGQPGALPIPDKDWCAVFSQRDDSPEGAAVAMAALAKSYLVAGGAFRSELAAKGSPLPRAIILVAAPEKLVNGEVVKTFVLTEHQVFLAESPVIEDGKSVRLGDINLLDATFTHNKRPDKLN